MCLEKMDTLKEREEKGRERKKRKDILKVCKRWITFTPAAHTKTEVQ